MKLHPDPSESGQGCESGPDMNPNHRSTSTSCVPEPLCNGSSSQSEPENFTYHCDGSEADAALADGVSSADESAPEDDLTPELQQAHRIFQSFLSEKHKSIAGPFWHPIGPDAHMSFRRMQEKLDKREYESITAFVADFRLMLENCYRFHGVGHWISKQAQKLEIILEQKLTLLSRSLREKTTLAVTSGGRFGSEDERAAVGSSSRRRTVPRSRASISVGGSESVMVQALRLEELQRAREQKRQREQERKEAEEACGKDLEDWEASLLSEADPWPVSSLWELPAIGHFLCLAQAALNLPEIVFYELERCLLMPRCSSFLSRLMTSLLSPPQRRTVPPRRAPLPYRRWELELRRRVRGWYGAVGRAQDPTQRAQQLGLSPHFFWTLGEVSPLEETPFHLLPFRGRVCLLKGLCDHVYHTQQDVQDAVLGQPIHECRESILGYDRQDNAYIHFPHFCGADLRIYCQSPSAGVELPLPPIRIRREPGSPQGSEVMEETHSVKQEDSSSSSTDLNLCEVRVDSLSVGEDLDQKRPSSLGSARTKADPPEPGSVRAKMDEERRLKAEDEDESDVELRFRVGENCYTGISPALDGHRRPETDVSTSCSESALPVRLGSEPVRPAVQPGVACTQRKRRRKRRSEMKTRLRMKSSAQRAASSIRMKERRRKLGKRFDGKAMLKRESGAAPFPAEPKFQLVCSSLDDLRVLISKIEDQLDELDDGKKRSGRWPHRRAAVKELHITLIRLLNELLPWEPKLLKAFQRNRARLKKEWDDFKKHPEYENFVREPMETTDDEEVLCKDGETTGELDDGEVRINTTVMDSETSENVNRLVNHSRCLADRPEIVVHSSESGPFTRNSKRRQSEAINDETSPCKKGSAEPESSELNVEVISREKASVSVLPELTSRIQGTCKPIQALLAKSVGNKVTLMSHPKAAVMAQTVNDHKIAPVTVPPVSTETPASTTTLTSESAGQVVYKTAGGVGLLRKASTPVTFSVQPVSNQTSGEKVMQQVVILPSNLLIQSTDNKTSASVLKNTTYLSNASGFTIPENKVPVQQVAPLKDTSAVKTPSAVVAPSLRTLMAVGVPKKTTEPKVALNKSGTSGLAKPDAKEELRTVCIRDSQSILVTTRGGNTGVVKVQASEGGARALPTSPVFTITPQLQAFLLSKSSTSITQAAPATPAAKPLPGVTRQCLSKDNMPFLAGTDTPLTLNQIRNNPITSIPFKSDLLAKSKNDSVLVSANVIQGVQQNTTSKPSQKRTPDSKTPDLSTFQKVFLVSPSTNISLSASKVSTSTATCSTSASRLLFMSSSALSIPKDASTSEVNISTTCTPALKVIPKLGTTLSCTSSGTSIQSIGVPGLTSRILGANKKTEASIKSTPVIVSRVSSTSTSSGIQFGPKGSLAASGGLSGNTEGSLKVSGTPDGKLLTFSTLGTGHMASSALLSVVKPDVPLSISTLNALHCKPGLTVGSSTSETPSSRSGSLITKHTTLPIDVTANKPVITSVCGSHSPIKTAGNICATGASSSVASSCSSASNPPVIVTSGIRPPTSTAKSVQEKIVINTTAPLAPGTQFLINNTRFVVPSQGLGPGSHVLLINTFPSPSPASCGGLQSPNPVRPICPGGLQGQSPASFGGLQSSNLVRPICTGQLQGPSSVTSGGLQSPNPVYPISPRGLQGQSPTISGGLQSPSSAGLQSTNPVRPICPVRLQGQSPTIPGGFQSPNPVCPVVMQGPRPVCPSGLLGPSPASTVPRVPNSSASHTVPSIGIRLVTPVRFHSPKVKPSDQVPLQLSSRTALNISSPTSVSQAPQALCPSVSSDIVRFPFKASNVLVTPSGGVPSSPKEASVSQGGSSSTTSTLLKGQPPQSQVNPIVTPVQTTIVRNSPMVTVPPMSSTVSRMQRLPVATVPPIGGLANTSTATPIATVPPSVKTVIMTACPSIRALQPGTVGRPVILPQLPQGQNMVPVHVPSSKLLLSPDGAVLNIVQASSVQVLAKPADARVVSSSSSSALNTHDLLGRPDHLRKPDH